MEYPQIRVATSPAGLGMDHGVQCANGEVVIAHDGQSTIQPEQLTSLYRQMRPRRN